MARRAIRRILWHIYIRVEERAKLRELSAPKKEWVGAIEQWVDRVHIDGEGKDRAMTTGLKERIVHAMISMVVYVRIVARPERRVSAEEEAKRKAVRKARWAICALLVREYKQMQQEQLLKDRQHTRIGRICENTRNVGRLAPKGGVQYDETRRNRPRIKDTDVYALRRWPRRDKCGPTLATALHFLWDIT